MSDIETPKEFPPGDYAIVELFGHTTLVGRIAEVERFGTKMLAIEPLFQDQLLAPVFYGGGAIYGLTPCSAQVAFLRQPRGKYSLPRPILATLPAPELEPPAHAFAESIDGEDRDAESDNDKPTNPL